MNSFPFPSEKYRQYKNTFLQDVTIGFDFPPTTVREAELNALFNEYAQSFFGVSSDGDLTTSICNITKKDQSQSFDFSDRQAVIHLKGREYIGFSDTAIPQIFKMRHFFKKVVKIENISKAGIRKLNVFNIKVNAKDKTTVDADPVMKSLFSPSLMSSLSSDGLNDEERTVPGMRKCVFRVADRTITLRAVLLPPSPSNNDPFHHLLLDTIGEIDKEGGIKVDDISEALMDFNKEIYDCYHWCVNENVKKVMLQADNGKVVKE